MKKAFTLAEVLITLGIIGIVAALTIPALVQKFQEKAWNTSATVFERKLEEALKVMNTRETLAGYKTTKDFVNELSNHVKITKVCDNPVDCFENTVYWGTDVKEVDMTTVTDATKLGQDEWETETLGIQFANGTSGIIAYNDYNCKQDPFSNQITGTSCIALVYDTTGNSKPNTYGKDLRGINASLGCAFTINGTCYGTPFWSEPLTKAECENLKGSLGINNCYDDEDYWAGAVKTCGGVQNMPSAAQLAKLADYLYNTSGIGAYEDYDGTLDTGKVASLGFGSVTFMVWSNEENSNAASVAHRLFSSTVTEWDASGRYGTFNVQAVCLN